MAIVGGPVLWESGPFPSGEKVVPFCGRVVHFLVAIVGGPFLWVKGPFPSSYSRWSLFVGEGSTS